MSSCSISFVFICLIINVYILSEFLSKEITKPLQSQIVSSNLIANSRQYLVLLFIELYYFHETYDNMVQFLGYNAKEVNIGLKE